MKKLHNILLLAALLTSSIMWLSSYTHYTSIGIDIDTQQQETISHHYYRIRWPGNGSIWLGGGDTQRASNPKKAYEPFDLAATFFYAKPQRPAIKNIFNHWGFWYQFRDKPNKQHWVGIPSWLPILFIIYGLFLLRENRP